MSNAGQAVLTVAGTIVGSYFGYPQLGFMLGSLAGNALYPTQLPGVTGPQLSDHNTVNTQLGAAVNEVIGTMAVAPTVIWLGPLETVSTTDEVGGKGGPTQDVTTFSYFQPIAYGLCRAPPGGTMSAILRIWENGKLTYDTRPQQDGEDQATFEARIQYSEEYADTFVLYLGGEDQLPDPTIEMVEGAGTVPAFRELMYMVYPRRQLLDNQAQRHPNLKIEVSEYAGATAPESDEGLILYLRGDDQPDGSTTFTDSSQWNQTPSAVAGNIAVTTDRAYRGPGSLLRPDDTSALTYNHNITFDLDDTPWTVEAFVYRDSSSQDFFLADLSVPFDTRQPFMIRMASNHWEFRMSAIETVGLIAPGDTIFLANDPALGPVVPRWQHVALCRYADGTGAAFVEGVKLTPGVNTVYHGSMSSPLTTLKIGGGGGGPLDVFFDEVKFIVGTAKYTENFTPPTCTSPAPGCTSIAYAIRRICARVGYGDDMLDIDPALEDRCIDGFGIQRVMTARDALQALIPVGLFDVVESGEVIKFPMRGKGIVATLSTTDLGARESGAAAAPSIRTTIAQDVELPRQIRLHYIATSRDYEPGEQLSISRVTSESDQVLDVSAAVAMNDTMALQCADILWSDAWEGRTAHEIDLDRSYCWLEGADNIHLPVNGRNERCRLVEITDQSGLLRKMRVLHDSDGSYVSSRIAAAPERAPNVLQVFQQTEMLLLDLPALRDVDDDAGFYAALRPFGPGTKWQGALIWRSLDGNGGWSNSASVTSAAIMGTIDTPPAVGIDTTWDETSEIIVTLANGELSSRSEAAILTGENTAAIGADGRWHLVQFRDVELIGGTQYRLTGLLQGRRGTEYLMGSVQAGDRFVLVSGPGVVRLPLDLSELGQDRVYRVVSAGKDFATGIDQTFAGHGQALVPFSPVHLEAERSGGNIELTWIRRGRIGRTLPSGTDIPLSEESESYDVDIYGAGSPTTVVRTLASSVQSVTYTAAQQLIDFGGAAPDPLHIKVYQLSAAVGRGNPGEDFV